MLPYCVTVDTEEEWDWGSGWPTTTPAVENIRVLPRFQDLCDRLGAATTYFVNHAVLADAGSREIILDLSRRDRVEIGMHIHPWNTPPLVGDGPVRARETFLRNLPDGLIDQKLESTYRVFVDQGMRPTSFRGGRFSSGGRVHEFLRDHGFIADSSIVPYTTWSDDGAPDYRNYGHEPIRHEPRCPGEAAFWEIPVSYGYTRRPERFWNRFYETVESTPLARFRLIGIAERFGIVRKVGLHFEAHESKAMVAYLRALRRRVVSHLSFMFHSSSLIAGGSMFSRTADDVQRLFERIEQTLRVVGDWPEFRSETITGIARCLEELHHASARDQSA